MYGSSLRMHTEIPRAFSSRPIDATVIPLPTDETTPPETKMYFVARAAPVWSTGLQRSTFVPAGAGTILVYGRRALRRPRRSGVAPDGLYRCRRAGCSDARTAGIAGAPNSHPGTASANERAAHSHAGAAHPHVGAGDCHRRAADGDAGPATAANPDGHAGRPATVLRHGLTTGARTPATTGSERPHPDARRADPADGGSGWAASRRHRSASTRFRTEHRGDRRSLRRAALLAEPLRTPRPGQHHQDRHDYRRSGAWARGQQRLHYQRECLGAGPVRRLVSYGARAERPGQTRDP